MVSTTEMSVNQRFRGNAETLGLQIQCLGSGNANSQIAIIAEAPGERECDLRMPQVGSGGKVLWESLRKYGITRNDVWCTNVVKRRLLGHDDDKLHINTNELAHWHSLLAEELRGLPNLKYIVAMGNMALAYLLGASSGILKYRGSIIQHEDKYILFTINPALVIREPKWEIVFGFDIKKLSKLIEGKWKPHEIKYLINPSPKEAIRYIEKMSSEKLPISFDIETVANETACVGIGNTAHEGMCINFRSRNGHHYSLEEERYVRRHLSTMFGNKSLQFVAQNGSFDCSWLRFKDRIHVHRVWFDTLLAHHTLYPSLPHNLGFLTAQYTSMPYYKDEKTTWREGGNIDEFWEYNIKDVCSTRQCQMQMENELHTQELDRFFFEHVMPLQPHLVKMTQIGVPADVELKQNISVNLRNELDNELVTFHNAVHTATGDPAYNPNPKSPKQMGELLFVRLRLVGRGTSTDEDNRTRMLNHPRTTNNAKVVLTCLNDYLERHKFVTTYADMELDPDGRFRCEYKQFGVANAPGRLSSAQTSWGTGGNLQNIPEKAKDMFLAPKGYRFVYFDLSQAEARCVAFFAGIPKWKEQFERARIDGKYDCHRALASEMFNVPYDETPEDDRNSEGAPTIRYIAKRCRHGLNYRMGPERLATVTGLTPQRAYEAYQLYHNITPELRKWWQSVIDEVRNTRKLYSAMGRRWLLLERFDERSLDSIVAFKPQSTIGDKVSSVIYKSQNDPNWRRDYHIVLNVHDALIAIVPDNNSDAIAALRIMCKYAEEPIHINGDSLIIPADCAWSVPDDQGKHRWSMIKKIKDKAVIKQIKEKVA